jgi:hypothetical protein
MASEMARIFSDPVSLDMTQRTRKPAKAKPRILIPNTSAIISP